MKPIRFVTTDQCPVRYEAQPGAWVEHARPHEVKHGELCVFTSGPETSLARSVYAAVETHAGSGGYVVELVVGGKGNADFVDSVFKRTTRWPEVRAALLAKLEELGFDVREVRSRGVLLAERPSRKRRPAHTEPVVETAQDLGTVRVFATHLGVGDDPHSRAVGGFGR